MAATFTPVLSPPQTLETLDVWSGSDAGGIDAGGIDALPWSLDSAVWNTAGVYGLAITEKATGGGTLDGRRLRPLALPGTAALSGRLTGAVARLQAGAGAALAGGSLDPLRVRLQPGSGAALAGAASTLLRGRLVTGTGAGGANGRAVFVRLRHATLSAAAAGLPADAVWQCLRALSGRADATAAESVEPSRLCPLAVTDAACGSATVHPLRVRLQPGSGTTALAGEASTLLRGRPVTGTGAGSAGGCLALFRLMFFCATKAAATQETLQPGYKGWDWRALPLPGHPADWQPLTTHDAVWQEVVQW
ncbi:MAG TPA: hypothetical protein IAB01_07500 [Candidatus Avidesulfovibrio excrementigallinarum]|nr:hypothetical protein [Candidatus Avidesulfovibrio excrementigallinarum]